MIIEKLVVGGRRVNRTVKVAISLSEELMKAAERERQASGESRSEFFRRAVQGLLRQEQERAAIERYVQGYRDQPESDEEVLVAQQMAAVALAQEPWE
jgi:metal-responsive CopG/Arc/MetJ family transcriptional regulator